MNSDQTNTACCICKHATMPIQDTELNLQEDTLNKCTKWLEDCSLSVGISDVCSCGTVESQDSSSMLTSDTGDSVDNIGYNSDGVALTDQILCVQKNSVSSNELSLIVNKPQNVFQNINITKSKKVHLGNKTYINGPIYINHDKYKNELAEYSNKDNSQISSVAEIVNNPCKIRIQERIKWLAQPSVEENERIEKPAKFVIICHSASDEGKTHVENVLLIRLIQQFHIESRKWNDIGYNFLVGADGNVYEGRGWGIKGAHTFGYNGISVGICFVGCYVSKLPPEISLKQAQALIEYGVEIGAIDPNYSLVGHCQTFAGASPGNRLFEEMKKWKNFDNSISLEEPA